MAPPPRTAVLIPGTFVLPDPIEEEGRLVFREPLGDTLVPLGVVGAMDAAACTGVAFAGSWLQIAFLLAAAALSFLVAALAFSLLRRPEVVLDRAAGRVRIRRPEDGARDLPAAEVRAVSLGTVKGSGGITAPAAGLDTSDGGWIPLHVGWAERRGGDAARVRVQAEAVARYLGVPIVDSAT